METPLEEQLPHLSQRKVTDENIRQMEPFIGQIMLSFGFIDQGLDFLLIELFEKAKAKNLASKMPFKLGDKVQLLSRCFERMSELSPLREEAMDLLNKIKGLNEVRNIIVHGALSHFEAEPEPRLVFVKLRYDNNHGAHMLRDHVLGYSTIMRTARYAGYTSGHLQRLAKSVMDRSEKA